MKRALKTTSLLIAILLLNFSCSKDDEVLAINLKDVKVTIDENPANGQVLGKVESDNSSSLTFSITTQTPAGALSINKNTGELTVADATLFDFETNPTITATVSANGALNKATVTISINNINELNILDFTATIDENPTNGQSLGTVQATGDATLSYSITSQTPTGALSINTSTGELTVADATLFDFETNPTITATVAVDNAGNIQNTNATINLNNVNELSIQQFNTTTDENPTNGQSLGTVQANGTGVLSFSIASQTPAGALSINASTGELTIADATLFDFETNPTITANISVNNSESTETATATVNLNDINEIGEFKFGGIIFWLNPSDSNHGLVCAVSDDPTTPIIPGWGCQGTNIAGAIATQIGQGQTNTTAILAGCSTAGIAADLASNSTSGGYTDWFLPSKDALQEIHTHRATINSTATLNGGSNLASGVFYWTSSQNDSNTAWSIYFDNNGAAFFLNKGTAGSNIKMRAVRAF